MMGMDVTFACVIDEINRLGSRGIRNSIVWFPSVFLEICWLFESTTKQIEKCSRSTTLLSCWTKTKVWTSTEQAKKYLSFERLERERWFTRSETIEWFLIGLDRRFEGSWTRDLSIDLFLNEEGERWTEKKEKGKAPAMNTAKILAEIHLIVAISLSMIITFGLHCAMKDLPRRDSAFQRVAVDFLRDLVLVLRCSDYDGRSKTSG